MGEQKSRYNAFIILQEISEEVRIDKVITPLTMLFAFLIILVIFPAAILWFAAMVAYADLPVVDHQFITLFADTKLMLFAYTVTLIFYFVAVSGKIANTKGKSYKKAIKLLWSCVALTPLPLFLQDYSAVAAPVYAVCFVLAMYYISKAYRDEDGEWVCSVQNERNTDFRTDELGIYGGLLDDPLRISDDMARVRLVVATAGEGFSWATLFVEIVLESWTYYVAISSKKYIRECVYFLDILFENGGAIPDMHLSLYAKKILKQKGYVVLTPAGLYITEKAELLAQKAAHG